MRPGSVPRLWPAVAAVGLLAFLGAAAGIRVPATHGAQTTADEPQYLLTAISLASDRDLDIADELAAGRWRAFHAPPLPEQTEPLASGRRLSPHDPLLPLLLAAPVAVGGWAGAKLAMAVLAGLLAGLLLWTAVRRFGVPVGTGAVVVAVFALSPPLAVYGTQVYPELPAALAVLAAVAALTVPGAPGRAGVVVVGVAVAALPWLAVKYVPVAAVLALLAVWRLLGGGARRRAVALAAGLVAAGAAFLVLHRWWYGGWTPYAAGDHFVAGELTAIGSDPDYLGRSRRLLGLATDRSFGLAAWQPAWLLAVPALATLARRRPAGWPAVALPLAAGWLVATFLALTMHGWWFPGRQVVVVLPLAVLAVACWAGGPAAGPRAGLPGRRRLVVAVSGGVGVVAYAWLVADGLAGRVTWTVDFFATGNPAYWAWRLVLPDYLAVTTATWVLHAAWLVVVAVWAAAAWRRAGTAAGEAPEMAAGDAPAAVLDARRMAGWTTPSPPA
ncbi:MAG TPA: hypothetical protein VFU54_04630 [Actinomycetota bacterium]|nr:hypothetical protein [Actinomycetota bacterium]